MDVYLLTGNTTYLDAVQGGTAVLIPPPLCPCHLPFPFTCFCNAGWDMFLAHWIHLGGSMAINEPWDIAYPPGSYYLDYTDTSHNGMNMRYGDIPPCQGPASTGARFRPHSTLRGG